MNLGLVARADQRGISYQTQAYYRHLQPAKVLCVLMNEPGWPENTGLYRDADVTFVDSNTSRHLNERVLDEHKARRFLKGLDVVIAVETVYDWAFCEWAREERCKVIVVGNPELTAHHNYRAWPHPDIWAWPTPWMFDQLHELGYPTVYELPVPGEVREFVNADPDDDVLRVLHVAGKAALGDRNGTYDFVEAVASLRRRVHVTIVTQERDLPRKLRHQSAVTVDVVSGGAKDRWSMYENQHLLVLPRKYGGLCLPAIEAMSCGVAVMMTDCSPNEIWPGPRIKARPGRVVRPPFGKVQSHGVHPIDVASMIDTLAKDRDRLLLELDDAQTWATYNSWPEIKPRIYDPLLEGLA